MKALAITALVLGLTFGAGWTVAQRLHNSVVIHACYKIRNGKLRLAGVMPDGALFCRRGELPIEWPARCCAPQ